MTPVVIAIAHRWQMLDQPGGRRVHKQAVPRLGGVAVFFGACIAAIATLAFARLEPYKARLLVGLLIGGNIMFLVGLVDDVRGVKPLTKVLAQLVAASVVVYAGLLPHTLIIAPGLEVNIGLLGAPLMLVWVIAVTNAYNLIDGLNGLASGIAIVACLGAAIIAGWMDRSIALIAVAAMGGALIGFLPYNYPRARIFLGDSGSMSIGFLLACLLVYAPSRPADGAVPIALPLTAMVLPFLDTGLAVVRRWLRGTRLSGADSRHIHHQLLALGLSHAKATAALWTFSAIVLGFGVLVVIAPPRIVLAVAMVGAMVLMAIFVYGASVLSYHELHVAVDVVKTGFGRARRVIIQQIHAVDVAHAIHRAHSLDEVGEVLSKHAASFGFLEMKVVREEHGIRRRMMTPHKSWRFEFELHPVGWEEAGYALNIWCESSSGVRAYGAERVARILAPAIELKLTQELHRTGEMAAPHLQVASINSYALRARRVSGTSRRMSRESSGSGSAGAGD